MSSKKAPNVALHLNLLPTDNIGKSRWQISSARYISGYIPGPESRNHSFWHSKTCSPLSHPHRPRAFSVFFFLFVLFFCFRGGEIAALTCQHADELALRSRWKGFLTNLHSCGLRSTQNDADSHWHSYFFIPCQFPVFLIKSSLQVISSTPLPTDFFSIWRFCAET